MGQVFDGILKRRSIRKYKNQEIPQDKLKKVLEAANWAPSMAIASLEIQSKGNM